MFEYKDRSDVPIEVYRNFEISFNLSDETFKSVSDYYDTEIKDKKSFSAVKKPLICG